jgi:hypothetical protein
VGEAQSMVSGFLAAFVGPVATGPFDVAKTRMMAQEKGAGTQYKVSFPTYRSTLGCPVWGQLSGPYGGSWGL